MIVPARITESARAAVRAQSGTTLFEALMATLILAIAAGGLLGAFDASRGSGSYAEKHDVADTIGERELLRMTALPWKKIALNETEVSGWTTSASSSEPNYYYSNKACASGAVLPPHGALCYQWNPSSSTSREPLVTSSVEGEYDEEKKDPSSFTTETASKTTRLSGKVYRYVTWVWDKKCEGGLTNTCESEKPAQNAKRITVAVTVEGLKTPVVLSTIYTDPTGEYDNPLHNGAKCWEGTNEVPCTD